MEWGLWDVLIVVGLSALTTCGMLALLLVMLLLLSPLKDQPQSEMD